MHKKREANLSVLFSCFAQNMKISSREILALYTAFVMGEDFFQNKLQTKLIVKMDWINCFEICTTSMIMTGILRVHYFYILVFVSYFHHLGRVKCELTKEMCSLYLRYWTFLMRTCVLPCSCPPYAKKVTQNTKLTLKIPGSQYRISIDYQEMQAA